MLHKKETFDIEHSVEEPGQNLMHTVQLQRPNTKSTTSYGIFGRFGEVLSGVPRETGKCHL